MKRPLPVDVVSVFTDQSGAHGNPLGLVRSNAATEGRELEIARILGFSETVFVDGLDECVSAMEHDVERVAVVRIFTPVGELPFAGHPSVGVSWWLAEHGTPVTALRVTAGRVAVRYEGDLTWITGRAEWAPQYAWHEFATRAEVDALDPLAFGGGNHYAWAWVDEKAGHLRSRMFAPDLGLVEDEATGAAALRLTAHLARNLTIDQGAGSRLITRFLGCGEVEVSGRTRPDDMVRVVLG